MYVVCVCVCVCVCVSCVYVFIVPCIRDWTTDEENTEINLVITIL